MPGSSRGSLIVLGLLALSAGAWWLSRGSPPPAGSPGPGAVPPSPIETALPRRRDFTRSIPFYGTVESPRVLRVVARADGRVAAQHVEDGAVVEGGAPLFTLGGALAKARLETLRARARFLEDRVAAAGRVVQKRREAAASRLLPQEQVAAAEGEQSRLQSDLAAARSAEEAFRESLTVSAPGGGRFTGRRVSPGQYVTKGTGLARILSTRELRVVARVFPPPGVVLPGKTVKIRAAGGRVVTATIRRILPERTAGGAAVAWIEGGGIDEALAPGEAVSGEVTVVARQGVPAVPESAVVRDEQERAWVFVEGPKGYVRRGVRTGLSAGGWVEVRSGLSETDRVVVRNAYELYYRDFRRTYKVED